MEEGNGNWHLVGIVGFRVSVNRKSVQLPCCHPQLEECSSEQSPLCLLKQETRLFENVFALFNVFLRFPPV